jgi:hypothetical protein
VAARSPEKPRFARRSVHVRRATKPPRAPEGPQTDRRHQGAHPRPSEALREPHSAQSERHGRSYTPVIWDCHPT